MLASLNASESGRSPWGTAMLAASSRQHIARGPAWGGPAPAPQAMRRRRYDAKRATDAGRAAC